MLDQFKSSRSRVCYRAVEVEEVVPIRGKVEVDDEEDFDILVSRVDSDLFFVTIAGQASRSIPPNNENWLEMLENMRNLVVNSQFTHWELFLDQRFCESIAEVLKFSGSLRTMERETIFLIEIVSQLWSFVPTSNSPLVSRDLVNVITDYASSRQVDRRISAACLFALANFAALGKECRDFLFEREIIPVLKRFLATSTGGFRGECGFRLASNILSYGIDDCWEQAICLIPVLRGNLMISNERSRAQAANCLCWIAMSNGGIEQCIESEVDVRVYSSILNETGYYPQIFQLIELFIDAGYYSRFIEPEFIDAVRSMVELHSKSGTQIICIFNYLWKIMKWAGDYLLQSGMLAVILETAACGCHGNRTCALVTIFHFLEGSAMSVVHDLANTELRTVTMDLIDTLDNEDLRDVLLGITSFLESGDAELASTWNWPEMLSILQSITTTDDGNGKLIQALIDRWN